VRAGALRHRVTLQSRVAGSPQQRPSGEPDETWADMATVFAAQQVHSEITGRIRIRWRTGVNASLRVTYGGRSYNILAVIDPEERHRELVLLMAEGLAEG
jgi:SPP1 family predicted phage head-tail adaptor